MPDYANLSFTEHDCRLTLQRYLRHRKKRRSCLAGLFCCCISGKEFVIYKVENYLAYKVTLESVIERCSNLGYSVLSPNEADSAKKESANPEVGREFESFERIVHCFSEAKHQSCNQCNGSGKLDCKGCNARGHIECDCLEELWQPELPSESIYGNAPCELCDGCTYCYSCPDCKGRLLVRCRLCTGTGETIHVPQVLIKRTVLHDRQVLDLPEGLDKSLVAEAEGLIEPNGGVAVKAAKAQLCQMHSTFELKMKEVITHQRLLTQCIPIAKVLYEHRNGKQGTFWVLGVSGNFCYCPSLPWAAFYSSTVKS